MLPKGHNTDLAKLLDGELHEMQEVERINAAIKADPDLMTEFEEQRSIKSLLGELEDFVAPSFMATRIMGEISAQRSQKRRVHGWKQALSSIGGVCAVALCVLALNGNLPGMPNATDAGIVANEAYPGTDYETAPWTKPDFNGTIQNENLRNLLEFASDAHRSSELEHVASSDSPNIDDLVLMVGQEGGSR